MRGRRLRCAKLMSNLNAIRERIDIVELIGESVKLRRSGRGYSGFCPFHPNEKTPSFYVWADTQRWRCFGACNTGGDVFEFVTRRQGLSFSEVVQQLAKRAGVELAPPNPRAAQESAVQDRLRTVLAAAANFYHNALLNSAAARSVREYLEGRGVTPATQQRFVLGYAPDSWDAGLKFFRESGYAIEDLAAAGLVNQTDEGPPRDRFRNRLMFPIRDRDGRTVGFGARALNPADNPKYLNSPQTELFTKGALLYGLDFARKAVLEQREAVLVEGYMDVIGAHQAGFVNVVSPMGTALSDRQLQLVRSGNPRIVLALDADAAGGQAVLRSLNVAREDGDREETPAFDPRGLVRNEARLKLDIRVAALPAGMDPDELIAKDPAAWRAIVANAQPVVDFVMSTLAAGRDLKSAKVKAELSDALLPIIQDVSHPTERGAYIQKLARLLHVDERTLVQAASPRQLRPRPPTPATAPAAVPESATSSLNALETHCLAALVNAPALLALVNRQLRELQLPVLGRNDFAETQYSLVFGQLSAALEQLDQEPLDYLNAQIEPALTETLQALLEHGRKMASPEERVQRDLVDSAVRLRQRTIRQRLTELQFIAEQDGAAPDVGAQNPEHDAGALTGGLQRIQRYLAPVSRRDKISGAL